MGIKFSELDSKTKRVLTSYPARNKVKWVLEDEKVVLIYPKDFSKIENWLHKRIGGPDMIRRPLDEIGSRIWMMCDGKHTIQEICTELDEIYHEDIEPVLDRVSKFLEILVKSNLIQISSKRVYPNKLRVEKND
jgi:hypothetical protein